MTKAKMIQAIQEKEAQAWMEYNRYCYLNSPTDKGYMGFCEWSTNDTTARVYRAAWASLQELMEAMEIEPIDNEVQKEAWNYHSMLYKACKEAEATA